MIGSTKTWRMLENYFQHGVFILTRVSDQIRFHLNMLWVNLFIYFMIISTLQFSKLEEQILLAWLMWKLQVVVVGYCNLVLGMLSKKWPPS